MGRSGNGFFLSRNVAYSVMLIGFTMLVGLFYMYSSASSEAEAVRHEYNTQADHLNKLKNELLEANTKLESRRQAESECTDAKDAVDGKLQTCQVDASKLKAQIGELEKNSTDKGTKITELEKQILDLQANITSLQTELTARTTLSPPLNAPLNTTTNSTTVAVPVVDNASFPLPDVSADALKNDTQLPNETINRSTTIVALKEGERVQDVAVIPPLEPKVAEGIDEPHDGNKPLDAQGEPMN